ncbi:MAG: SMC-Scp complex subunit ScpB, partial [Mycolicibacterium aromaticivorans]|nr:SMC-Scp complex subunit ScpB [Mycolicibacterium aromaticivorans]
MTDDAADIPDVDLASDSGSDLATDVALPEMDDDELVRVLEALLLVVDTPVNAETLAS